MFVGSVTGKRVFLACKKRNSVFPNTCLYDKEKSTLGVCKRGIVNFLTRVCMTGERVSWRVLKRNREFPNTCYVVSQDKESWREL